MKSSVLQQQFTLRLKRFTRIGFTGIGWFLLLIGLALLLVIDLSAVSMVDRSAIIIVMLAAMGMGIVYLRIGKVCRVEVNGEQMRVVSMLLDLIALIHLRFILQTAWIYSGVPGKVPG